MKTTKIKNYLLALAAGSVLCSCNESSFLNEVNPNRPTDATYWQSADDLDAAIATVYNRVRASVYGYYGAYNCFQAPNNSLADDIYTTIGEEKFTWDYVIFNNSPETDGNPWDYLYTAIQRSNVLLKNTGEDCPVKDEIKNPIRGEAYFFRGFNYYLLAINYGKAIIRTEPVISTLDIAKEMSSAEEVWAQAETDLKKAIELLPESRPAAENGRVTKGAAIAFLGKSYLFQKKYAEAKTELGKLMQAPYAYDLVENYEDNFRDDTEFNKESIFELNYDQFGDESGRWNGGEGTDANMGNVLANFFGPDLPASGGWYKMQPSAALVDEFIAEERPAGSDSRWDKRMYTTMYFKYSDYNDTKADETWYNDVDFDPMWQVALGKKLLGGKPDYPTIDGKEGRFLLKKYSAWWSKSGCSFYGGETTWSSRKMNYRVMRFAEVLLMYAEACAQTNDIAGANAALKRVRDRAGLAEKTFGSQADLIKEIQHQNMLELVEESTRWYYLKHWFNNDELKAFLVDQKTQGGASFTARYRWLPVPFQEMNNNSLCTQTEGWE